MKLRDVRPQTEHQNSSREAGDHGSCLGGPCIPPGPGQLNQHPKEEDRLWVKVARRIRHPNEPARGRSRRRHQRDEAGYSGPERRSQLPPSQRDADDDQRQEPRGCDLGERTVIDRSLKDAREA